MWNLIEKSKQIILWWHVSKCSHKTSVKRGVPYFNKFGQAKICNLNLKKACIVQLISKKKFKQTKSNFGKWVMKIMVHSATFPRKFLSINIFADFTSRWIYTGTVCSWMYSRPLAESRAICTLLDHGNGSLPGIHVIIIIIKLFDNNGM